MEKSELERIAKEYCDSLYNRIIDNIPKFEKDWNGLHVRAVAFIIQELPHPNVKKAIKQIKRSSAYYEMDI